jgi:hypothetical protein
VPGAPYWLVAELVDRLRDIVPDGFTVSASVSGSGVETSALQPPVGGQITYVEELVEQLHGSFEENVELAARNVLSDIQDVIAEETAEPWPRGLAGPELSRARHLALEDIHDALPSPDAAVESGVLHAWYGDRHDPVLALPPIPLPPGRASSEPTAHS